MNLQYHPPSLGSYPYDPAALRCWKGLQAAHYDPRAGFERSRQADPYTEQWPGDSSCHELEL